MGALTYIHLFGLLAAQFFLPGTEASCPPEWFEYRSHCYGVDGNLRTWMDAEVECQSVSAGAHLASLHSEMEHVAIAKYIRHNFPTVVDTWIGLHDPRKNRKWSWSDSSPFYYQAWHFREPNNADGNEDCVHIANYTGYMKWNDVNCNLQFPSVCKTKL